MIDKSEISKEINEFLNKLDGKVPDGFITFYKTTNGKIFNTSEKYGHIWSLEEIVKLNVSYNVKEFAPEMLVFGSDGVDIAFAIKRLTGEIYKMPFIGMSMEESKFVSSSFNEFIKSLKDGG